MHQVAFSPRERHPPPLGNPGQPQQAPCAPCGDLFVENRLAGATASRWESSGSDRICVGN